MNVLLTASNLIPFASLVLATTDDRSIILPTTVPSGYARQAQLEASLRNGFRPYDAQAAR